MIMPDMLLLQRIEKDLSNQNEILRDVAKLVADQGTMLSNHEIYISDGKKWRAAVLGLIATMIIQCCGGLYLAGQLTERVNTNQRDLGKVSQKMDSYDSFIRDVFRIESPIKRGP